MECPKCHYQRKATDVTFPDWQCPSCGVAYAKASGASLRSTIPSRERAQVTNRFGERRALDYVLSVLVLGSILLTAVAWWYKDSLPPPVSLLSATHNIPLQTPTQQQPFTFAYRGENYAIEPVADYELWGLVVTHNDITGFTDIMHTKDSVDIKDICVIWGTNANADEYRKVSYSSGDFICYFEYPYGTNFDQFALSNNHLLADNEAIRDQIRQTHIGDQIHLQGLLVNYHRQSNPDWTRRTSTTRQDTGNGACEVIFVQDYEILHSNNRVWHTAFRFAPWAIVLSLLLKIVSMAMPQRRS
jgi:hypothetical protein